MEDAFLLWYRYTALLIYEVTNMGQCNFYQLYVLLVVKFIVGTNVHGGKLLFIICTSYLYN